MNKMYPPTISGKLPAFVKTQDGTGAYIKIPFNMNRTVSYDSVGGFALKLKTIGGFDVFGAVEKPITDTDTYARSQMYEGVVEFELTSTQAGLVYEGQFYKAQIAYINLSGEVSDYYSTVGVIKCIGEPKFGITGLQNTVEVDGEIEPYTDNVHKYFYIGEYEPSELDSSEKLYSSSFSIYKDSLKIAASGELIHDNAKGSDEETFVYLEEIDDESDYEIEYSIKTINGYEDSRIYTIKPNDELDDLSNFTVSAGANFDQGYNRIEASSAQDVSVLILRKADDGLWEYLDIRNTEEFTYKDYAIEQGVDYTYAVQGYNSDTKEITSNKKELCTIYSDFEDIFLWDGDRQLNIRFNPKVSSYKNTVYDSKTDTLGGKYPIFSRNGNTNYIEFPISGLVSYHMDNEDEFIDKGKLKLEKAKSLRGSTNEVTGVGEDVYIKTRNLDGRNMYAERIFRQEVLAWLNNGKAKLFKSSSEGTHIVRLMNVSMSPEDTLGRLIFSFSCNAYEIADFDMDNIRALLPGQQRVATIGLRTISELKVGGN